MRIGVNALYLIPGGVGGTEIYLRCLLDALARIDTRNEYVVFTNRETGPDLVPRAAHFRHAPQQVSAVSRPARILWEQIMLPLAAARQGLDVLFNPGFTAPLLAPCRQVTVFHDLQHKRHPENFRWFDLPVWRFLLFWSAHLSQRLVSVSRQTTADLRHYYRLDARKIVTAPSGVDLRFFDLAWQPDDQSPYLLAVSTLHPHKNLDGLMRSFAALDRPGLRLVIAGLRGFAADALEAERETLGLRDRVEFTGWIPRQSLYELFARCQGFVFPSRFEGFGMPVLEALAAGIPCACSGIEPMASHTGEAALHFHPSSTESMRHALARLLDDVALRERLHREGPLRARDFSWDTAARRILEALQNDVRHS